VCTTSTPQHLGLEVTSLAQDHSLPTQSRLMGLLEYRHTSQPRTPAVKTNISQRSSTPPGWIVDTRGSFVWRAQQGPHVTEWCSLSMTRPTCFDKVFQCIKKAAGQGYLALNLSIAASSFNIGICQHIGHLIDCSGSNLAGGITLTSPLGNRLRHGRHNGCRVRWAGNGRCGIRTSGLSFNCRQMSPSRCFIG
jgi:hypothetical protein